MICHAPSCLKSHKNHKLVPLTPQEAATELMDLPIARPGHNGPPPLVKVYRRRSLDQDFDRRVPSS